MLWYEETEIGSFAFLILAVMALLASSFYFGDFRIFWIGIGVIAFCPVIKICQRVSRLWHRTRRR